MNFLVGMNISKMDLIQLYDDLAETIYHSNLHTSKWLPCTCKQSDLLLSTVIQL